MTTIIHRIDPNSPDTDIIASAGQVIRSGGLVAFPTETVYGLGADALNPDAVSRIYEAKGRPSDNPLILHVATLSQAESLVVMNPASRELARTFWPGPLTMVLPSREIVPSITRGGLTTVAVRMPDNPVALALIRSAGTPIAAPSANRSGRPSPTDAQSVLADMDGRIPMILDGGRTITGIESTVIDLTDPEHVMLLRPGGLEREKLEAVLGQKLAVPDTQSMKRSPGTRYRHYAPNIPVKIWRKGEAFPESNYSRTGYIGVNNPPFETGRTVLCADTQEYSHELFAAFRDFEAQGLTCIIAEWPEGDSGIIEGLRDRIIRAAVD